MKHCTRCHEYRPLSEYHKHKRSPDGHQPRCKSCVLELRAAYRAEKSDAIREYNAEWYRRNREHDLARRTAHHEANRERENARARARYHERKAER